MKMNEKNNFKLKKKGGIGKMGFVLLSVLVVLLLIPMISAQISFCCERLDEEHGAAWCQNSQRDSCDESYKIAPTACDSTSYCKRGCCYDSREGLCSENTPERVCEESGGTWSKEASCNIAQCELGCCILGGQAALVTMTRCKALSGFYGLEIDFRQELKDEIECIATANAQDKGACVFEDTETHSKTCKFTTRAECDASEKNQGALGGLLGDGASRSGKSFHKDVLCSADELATVCGRSTKTMLVEGRDEVYFQDTCGNPANIYDASKKDDNLYWTRVYSKAESCGAGSSNAKSKICGNCDYFLGSIGKKKSATTGAPAYGDYICADLGCKGHQHGESWCVKDKKPNGVGSRYYKQICLSNEILVEPCEDYRSEICIQSNTGGFTESACVANRGKDCVLQADRDDCENTDKRDCKWIEGYYFSTAGLRFSVWEKEKAETFFGIEINTTSKGKGRAITPSGLCAPKYAPGFNFWGDSEFTTGAAAEKTATEKTDAGEGFLGSAKQKFGAGSSKGTGAVEPKSLLGSENVCGMGNTEMKIVFKKTKEGGFKDWGDWKCIGESSATKYKTGKGAEICQYFDKDEIVDIAGLAKEFNAVCSTLGDCGSKANWIGKKTEDGFALYFNSERIAGSGGAEILEKTEASTTGDVIKDLLKNVFGNSGGEEEAAK